MNPQSCIGAWFPPGSRCAETPGDDQDPRDSHGAVIYDDGVTLEETWGAMEDLVDEGLTRGIGLSDIGVDGTRF
jgi:diketogulonate reductase-like aldo/keto reductase